MDIAEEGNQTYKWMCYLLTKICKILDQCFPKCGQQPLYQNQMHQEGLRKILIFGSHSRTTKERCLDGAWKPVSSKTQVKLTHTRVPDYCSKGFNHVVSPV